MDALPADIPYTRLMPPAILLFGDDPARRLRIADAVSRCGGRVVASAPIADAPARIAMQAAAGGVILDIRYDGGQALDALVERVDALGEASGRLFALLIVPPALIDVVDARLPGLGARLLVDPSERELTASVTELVAPPLALVEEGAAAGRRRLAELSEEVGRIARALASLSADDAERVPAPSQRMVVAADGPLIRSFIRLRRLRAQHFLPELFADPAWDILLDLAVARIEGRMVAVSSLCIAAAVPATTALRWIAQMTEQALLIRRPDPTDGRRVFIGLSDHAAAGMDAYLSAARGVVSPAG